jgi:aspartate kinase
LALVVQKFGGSSVADVERIRNVARIVLRERDAGNDVVVVVSAMGKTTDSLLHMAYQITPEPDPREIDMLISTGEQVSISMLALAIHSMGRDAISFTGPQVGILTDRAHRKAKIRHINDDRIRRELKAGKVVIVAGFQGITEDNEITTLGRGGSDTTAVALAAALKADICDIYTDVDGVYTADPRIVKNARKLRQISYDEMLELASLGAKVLHSRSVELAKNFNVPVQVRSSFEDVPGTMIVAEAKNMEDIVVSGVAHNRNEGKISILGVPDRPGIAAEIFVALGNANISVDTIVQNVGTDGHNDISFTVNREDFAEAMRVSEEVAKAIGARSVTGDQTVGKVSVVGVGMKSHAGVAASMFKALASAGVNIDMISTSEIKISCIIPEAQLEVAINAIHDQFGLANEA